MVQNTNPAAGAVASFHRRSAAQSILLTIVGVVFLPLISVYAEDPAAADSLPSLEVLPSEFVSILEYRFEPSGPAVVFEASFTISGEGIYGHFDLTFFDAAGADLGTCSSGDSAYRRDHGAKVKSVTISCAIPETCTKVQVYFHEMRVNPDTGPCMNGGQSGAPPSGE